MERGDFVPTILVVSGALRAGGSGESPEGENKSLRSLKAISRRILSFSHRMANASNDRKRRTKKNTTDSMCIIPSSFR
jgi:hypothetical protein